MGCWRLAPGPAPACRSWGGEVVVHHALSNDTYRMSALAGCVLNQLATAEGLRVDELMRACTPASPDELLDTLDALADLALVAPC